MPDYPEPAEIHELRAEASVRDAAEGSAVDVIYVDYPRADRVPIAGLERHVICTAWEVDVEIPSVHWIRAKDRREWLCLAKTLHFRRINDLKRTCQARFSL